VLGYPYNSRGLTFMKNDLNLRAFMSFVTRANSSDTGDQYHRVIMKILKVWHLFHMLINIRHESNLTFSSDGKL